MIKYDSYKASGIEWLGDIPSHWDIKKVKWIFRHVTQMAEKNNSHELLSVYTDIGVKPRKELEDRGNKATTTDNYWIVKKGDIIVNKLLAWMGAVGLSNYDGVTSPAYDVLRAIKDIDVRYYNYIFRSSQILAEFKKRSKGIMEMRLRLYFDELGQILFPLPPKEEQEAIADFLDKKTDAIDTYILKQKEIIELLKEKKSSLINDAVTKGLDSNVEYKQSGIEWLGEIPRHWEVKKLKYVYKIIMGQSPDSSDVNQDKKGMAFLQGNAEFGIENPIEKNWCSHPRKIAIKNDILYSVRAPIGAVNIANKEYTIGRGLCALRTNDNFKFLYYLSQSLKKEFDKYAIGSTFEAISVFEIKNISIPKVPKEEQKQIVTYIEKESKKIDDAISHIEEEIKLLQEYKQSIISSAVTGKIKVFEEKPKQKETNIKFKRAVLGAYIIDNSMEENTFGHVKFQKLLYMCEAVNNLDFGSDYKRHAMGPHDPKMLGSIEGMIKKSKWFEAKKIEKRYKYYRLEKSEDYKKYIDRYWDTKNIDKVLNMFKPMNTEQSEIIATLYSAWSDLLEKNQDVKDDEIINEVLNNWHDNKKKISKDRWEKALNWMREKELFPRG